MTYKQAIKLIETNENKLAIYARRYGIYIHNTSSENENAFIRYMTIQLKGFQVELTQSNGEYIHVGIVKNEDLELPF